MADAALDLRALIRTIPDFPKPGILFRDITPLLARPDAVEAAVARMAAPHEGERVDAVLGIEARGFIFGQPLALALGTAFVPIRKPGKLPGETRSAAYQLEYGENRIEMHTDALKAGDRVVLVDDLLATGGTMAAACELVEQAGATILGIEFLIELTFLPGREALEGYAVRSQIAYDSEEP